MTRGHAAVAALTVEPSRERGSVAARGVQVQFAGVRALDAVDIELYQGDILGLIGPNGAGKTTLVNVLSGFQPPTRGRVVIDEADVTKEPAQRRAARGLIRTFQGGRFFGTLSVTENVEVAAVCAGLRRPAARRRAGELLGLCGLTDRREDWAEQLSHGEERRLGIARALAGEPRYLLLDEPAAGLNESEGDALVELIRNVRGDRACGVLLIEHNMRVVMSLCDRIQVLDHGKVIAVGSPEEIRRDAAVIEAYLGPGASDA